MKQVPVLQIYNKLQKEYVEICWQKQEEAKSEKENLPVNIDENTCNLALLQLHVVNRCRDPYALYASKIIKRCNETFLTCSLAITFIRSTAIFKASQRLFKEMNSQKKKIKRWKLLNGLFLMHRICVLLKYLKQKTIILWEMLLKPCILFHS